MRLLFALVALVACALAQTQNPCVWTDKTTGHTWDLTSANQAKDYVTPENASA